MFDEVTVTNRGSGGFQMIFTKLESSRARARAGGSGVARPCGHDRHVGICAVCQRAQLSRWSAQVADALEARGRHEARVRLVG
jgi:hypothetical protein